MYPGIDWVEMLRHELFLVADLFEPDPAHSFRHDRPDVL